MPCTRAITGWGICVRVIIILPQRPEQILHESLVVIAAHLLEIVSGTEGLAGTGNDHDAHCGSGAIASSSVLQGTNHGLRQGVELTCAIQRQGGDAVMISADNVEVIRIGHRGVHLSLLE
jgi:hypothetical protein